MEDQTISNLKQASEIAHKVNSVQNDINSINSQIARLKQTNGSTSVLTILAVLLGWIPGLVLSYLIYSLAKLASLKTSIIAISFLIHLVLIGFAVWADIRKTAKNRKERDERLAYLQGEANSRNAWISSYLEKHSEIVSKVPATYFYPIAIDYFIEVLSNGRADTFKEAMNLYEEQLHRWKIEDMTKSAMIAQQQTAANSAAIRTTSAINAAANVANLMRK